MIRFWDRKPFTISCRKRDIWSQKTSLSGILCPCLRSLPYFPLSSRRRTCLTCSESSPPTTSNYNYKEKDPWTLIRRWVLGPNKSKESKYSNLLFRTNQVEAKRPWATHNRRQHQHRGPQLRMKRSQRNSARKSNSLLKRQFWNSKTERTLTIRTKFLNLPLNFQQMSSLLSNCSCPSLLDREIISRIDISNWLLRMPRKRIEVYLIKLMIKITTKTRSWALMKLKKDKNRLLTT